MLRNHEEKISYEYRSANDVVVLVEAVVVVEVAATAAAAGGGVATAIAAHITWLKSQISYYGGVKAMTLNTEKYWKK